MSGVLYYILNRGSGPNLIIEWHKTNWAPFVLGFVVVGLEVGFIYAYKAGWPVSMAQIVSSAVLAVILIVVAVAGIAGFSLPSRDLGIALRLCRFTLVLLASMAGMFGIVAGMALLLWHLCSIESFGRPYMGTLSGTDDAGSRATLVRRPPWRDIYRDRAITGTDQRMRK